MSALREKREKRAGRREEGFFLGGVGGGGGGVKEGDGTKRNDSRTLRNRKKEYKKNRT